MLQSGDENCLSTGKERGDRQVHSSNRFDALQIDVNCPDTAILLLGSRERPVLVAAAAALTKFAAKGKDNLQTLFELDVVDNLLPLTRHEDLFTRRFAMRLLAELAAMPFVRDHLCNLDDYLGYFAETLIKDTDTFVQEFLTLILAEISKDPYGTAKMLELRSIFEILFVTMKSPDPDVKKNTIELVNKLLKDPVAAERIVASQVYHLRFRDKLLPVEAEKIRFCFLRGSFFCRNKVFEICKLLPLNAENCTERRDGFSFPLIYQLFEQPYPAIQSPALSVVESLVARSKDSGIQKLFKDSGGLGVLLDLLDNIDFSHLHSDVLRILIRAADNAETAEFLNSGGGIAKLFRYLESSGKAQESRDAVEVLVRLASTESGRKTLHTLGLSKNLLGHLRKSTRDSELARIVCHGIGMMARNAPAAREITEENPIKLILDIVEDENLKWQTREAAIFALKELSIGDEKNRRNLFEIGGHKYLQGLLRQPTGKLPLEIATAVVDVLDSMGEYPDTRKQLAEVDLIDALCSSFEAKDRAYDELKISCCKALSSYCVDKRARVFCLETNLVKKLFGLLQDVESTPVRAAAVQLVQQLCADPSMAEQFVQAGYLNYMLKNRSASTIVPTWDTCIDALFSAHLPVKFAATGRLSLHEVTHDGFYVMRRHICPFPILDELFRLKMCPMEPVYVVNCAELPSCSNGERYSSREGQKCADLESAWFEVKFGKLQTDPYLCEYLTLFKCVLAANEPGEPAKEEKPGVVNISRIASRAKLLGKFVARQMSGPDPRNPCIDHQLDIHVREIREDLQTSVIPLGQLRVGSYLERALLFKVIADSICLPAALVRGEYGKAWIEIAVPEIENVISDTDPSVLPKVLDPRITASKKSLLRHSHRRRAETSEKSNDSPADPHEESDRVRVTRDNLKNVLPTKLLQENYIVDLMEKPGDLIPIRSGRARAYCAPISRCVMTCDL